MVRIGRLCPPVTRHFPHTRGDGPRLYPLYARRKPFSPHAWGWSDYLMRRAARARIFPTRVGMVRIGRLFPPDSRHFPHTRGDGPIDRLCHLAGNAFSPHAWGWSASMVSSQQSLLIFPTRVGMVRHEHITKSIPNHFPHTRGDGPHWDTRQRSLPRFSPHAWGWSDYRGCRTAGSYIFPTRVGMVRVSAVASTLSSHFPHTRGDGP